MENKEKIYDEKISPLVDKIISICSKENLSFFMTFQYNDKDFCTSYNGEDSHAVIPHHIVIQKCIVDKGVNVDSYIFWLIREARKYGHSSLNLKLLGVDEKPKDKED